MTCTNYRRLVRISALYDLLVTAPFATPWTFALVFQALSRVSPLPEFQPEHVLFANLLGCIVVGWSALRLWQPEPVFGWFDAMGRGMFFALQLYYLLVHHVTPVLWGFAVCEFAFGAWQAVGYWRLSPADRHFPQHVVSQ